MTQYERVISSFIFPFEPNWEDGITVKLRSKTAIVEALNGKENRVACFRRPLFSQVFNARNYSWIESLKLRNYIHVMSEQAVGVPLWMDAVYVNHGVNAGENILRCNAKNRCFSFFEKALLWQNVQQWETVKINPSGGIKDDTVELIAGVKETYGDGAYLIPLVYGKIIVPTAAYLNAGVSDAKIEFEEVQGVDLTNYGVPDDTGDYTFFDYKPNFGSPKTTSTSDIYFEAVNAGSPTPYKVFRTNKRRWDYQFLGDRAELQKAIKHFINRDGSLRSFDIPTFVDDYTVTQDTAADGEIVLAKTGIATLGLAQFGKLQRRKTGEVITIANIAETRCHDIIEPEPPIVPEKDETFSQVYSARYANDELTISAKTPDAFEFSASFIEVVNDTENVRKFAWLYEIDGWCYANWGTQISLDGKDYIPDDITHGELAYSADLLGDELEIMIGAGVAKRRVLELLNSGKTPAIKIGCYEVLSGGYTPKWEGVIESFNTEFQGRIRCKCTSPLRVLKNETPTIALQRQCNNRLFDERCGLSKSDFAVNATFSKVSDYVLTSANIPQKYATTGSLVGARLGGLYTVLADYSGGQRFLKVNKKLPENFDGVSMEIVPWCDKTVQCCKLRFNNISNFGGCPWLPSNNPLEQVALDDSLGGKK